jgi:protein O-GlcNAc transferase
MTIYAGERLAILENDPHNADALHRQGLLACKAGQYDQAAAYLEAAIRIRGGEAPLHNSLGMVRHRQGRKDEAIACYRRALEIQPALAQAHNNLGNVLKSQGCNVEAIACYEEARRLDPNLAEPHNNLGNLFKQMGRLAEAESCYRSAVRLRPALPQPHYNLGQVLAKQERLAEAVQSFQEALRLGPDYAEAHIALGEALARMGQPAQAEASYRQALRLRPQHPLVLNNLAMLLGHLARIDDTRPSEDGKPAQAAQDKRDEALACLEQAVRLQADYADALNNLANCYLNQGRMDEALACFRRAVATQPDNAMIHSALLFALHYHAGYDPEACYAEHLRWAEKFDKTVVREAWGVGRQAQQGQTPHASRPTPHDPNRRLRIGYVSADFYNHVAGRYCVAVIPAHHRDQVEVFCYANVPHPDAVSARIQAAADHWRAIDKLSDAQAADLVAEDQIDLLIDLSGHTAGNRLGIFALKPAPIQVTHLGYLSTTALSAMDYRLTDAYCDPPGQTERWHVEQLVRLPRSWWCYVPWASPEVGPLPAQRPGSVTFACVSTLAKVTDEMIGLWARILTELPESRMVVVTGAGRAGNERVVSVFARHGIDPERLTLVPRQGTEGYLRLIQDVDIVLDVYPFTGCNTTGDALWMGVPVVTRIGPTAPTRQGLLILSQVGLEDLAASTADGYVETAVALAQDLPRLRALRGELRGRLQRTLGDVERHTRELEAAYREMWRIYCGTNSPCGLPPVP